MCAHFSDVITAIYKAGTALTAVRHVFTIYGMHCIAYPARANDLTRFLKCFTIGKDAQLREENKRPLQ